MHADVEKDSQITFRVTQLPFQGSGVGPGACADVEKARLMLADFFLFCLQVYPLLISIVLQQLFLKQSSNQRRCHKAHERVV